MSESLIGREVNVCNCGPSCKCGHWSHAESRCPCNKPTVRRRILAEDARRFYVSQTGDFAEADDEVGEEAFTSSNGQPLQWFPIRSPSGESFDEHEAVSRHSGTRTLTTGAAVPHRTARSGNFMNVAWSFEPTGDRRGMLRINGQPVHLRTDLQGGWISHLMAGRWADPERLVQAIIKYHPNFNPLARPRVS